LDRLLSPDEATLVQPTDGPFQGHPDDDVRVAGGVRQATEHAAALVDPEPARTLDEDEPGLLDVPEARHFLPVHDAQPKVAQRPDGGDLVTELRADPGGVWRLAVDEGASNGGVVGRSAPLAPVVDGHDAIEGLV